MTDAARALRLRAAGIDPAIGRVLGRTALDAKKRWQDAARRATGGDGRLSGRRNARLSVRYDFQRGQAGRAVKVRAVGPWALVEFDRAGGYRIPKAKGRGANRRRAAPRLGGPRWSTGPLHGGRMRGRHPWARTLPDVLDAIRGVFVDELGKVL